jgi:hypothetical protein
MVGDTGLQVVTPNTICLSLHNNTVVSTPPTVPAFFFAPFSPGVINLEPFNNSGANVQIAGTGAVNFVPKGTCQK